MEHDGQKAQEIQGNLVCIRESEDQDWERGGHHLQRVMWSQKNARQDQTARLSREKVQQSQKG